MEEARITTPSESAETTATDADASPTDASAQSPKAERKLKSKAGEKQEIQEEYVFQRVHYRHDIMKIQVIPGLQPAKQEPLRELQIDELPTLYRAAARGILPEVIRLLDAGESVNATLLFQVRLDKFTFKGCTPLQLASWFGKAKAINLLLDHGANIAAQDIGGSDALVYAICGEDPGVIVVLLVRGADTKSTDILGRTALPVAARYGGHNWLTHILLQHGSEVATPDLN